MGEVLCILYICICICRPVFSEKRLTLTPSGNVRYQLKTAYRDGMTHMIFKPLDFVAWLVALVPKPRIKLTRFYGVFTPNSKHRASVTRPIGAGEASYSPKEIPTSLRRPNAALRCAGVAPVTGLRGRYGDLPGPGMGAEDYRLQRRNDGDEEDHGAP